jgi:hypothetical protein
MPKFECPIERVEYDGPCPVKTCIAFDKKAASGCIYQEVKECNAFSIGHRWKLTNTQIKKSYKFGVKLLTDTAKFYHLAQQHYVAPLKYCSNCGVAGENCLNTIRCNRRAIFAKKQLTKIPMRVLTKPTMQFFWVTIENKLLQEFFSAKTIARANKLLSRRTIKNVP